MNDFVCGHVHCVRRYHCMCVSADVWNVCNECMYLMFMSSGSWMWWRHNGCTSCIDHTYSSTHLAPPSYHATFKWGSIIYMLYCITCRINGYILYLFNTCIIFVKHTWTNMMCVHARAILGFLILWESTELTDNDGIQVDPAPHKRSRFLVWLWTPNLRCRISSKDMESHQSPPERRYCNHAVWRDPTKCLDLEAAHGCKACASHAIFWWTAGRSGRTT